MPLDFAKLSIWSLRLGLALTYLYSSFQIVSDPAPWIGYLPSWFIDILPFAPEVYLRLQGAAEFLMALSFLNGIGMAVASAFSAIEMAGILVFYGIDLVSFRDIAILGAALSLFFYSYGQRKN